MECPRCKAVFDKDNVQRTEDNDSVRCPNCNRRQDGLGHLEDRLTF